MPQLALYCRMSVRAYDTCPFRAVYCYDSVNTTVAVVLTQDLSLYRE